MVSLGIKIFCSARCKKFSLSCKPNTFAHNRERKQYEWELNMNIVNLTNILTDIHSQLLTNTAKAINIAVTIRNWLYGYYIHEYELHGHDRAEYGEKVIENLSTILQSKNIPSVSHRHLKLCRQFYRHYSQIGHTVFAQFEILIPHGLPDIGQTAFAQCQKEGKTPCVPSDKLISLLSLIIPQIFSI